MSLTINNMINKYAYTNSTTGQARVNLDTSADGVWSEKEVERYAAEYEEATGEKIDAKAIFDTYDANKDGALDYSEYDAALGEDALGVSRLMQLHAAELAAAEAAANGEAAVDGDTAIEDEAVVEGDTAVEESGAAAEGEEVTEEDAVESEEEAEYPTELSEFLANLSDVKRLSLIKSTFQAESTANLINSMLDPDAAFSNLTSLISQYGSAGFSDALESSLSSTFDLQA